ncbi:hypothetical protein Dimus_026635 [Dionaea muscipula]
MPSSKFFVLVVVAVGVPLVPVAVGVAQSRGTRRRWRMEVGRGWKWWTEMEDADGGEEGELIVVDFQPLEQRLGAEANMMRCGAEAKKRGELGSRGVWEKENDGRQT